MSDALTHSSGGSVVQLMNDLKISFYQNTIQNREDCKSGNVNEEVYPVYHVMMERTQQFNCFSRLPSELRIMIWEFAPPDPRILRIHRQIENPDPATTNFILRYGFFGSSLDVTAFNLKSYRSVCHEALDVFHANYSLVKFSRKNSQPEKYIQGSRGFVDFKRDYFLIADRDICDLRRHGYTMDASQIRNSAFFEDYQPNKHNASKIKKMRSLEFATTCPELLDLQFLVRDTPHKEASLEGHHPFKYRFVDVENDFWKYTASFGNCVDDSSGLEPASPEYLKASRDFKRAQNYLLASAAYYRSLLKEVATIEYESDEGVNITHWVIGSCTPSITPIWVTPKLFSTPDISYCSSVPKRSPIRF